jgi:hypothetical protein
MFARLVGRGVVVAYGPLDDPEIVAQNVEFLADIAEALEGIASAARDVG